MGLEQQLLFDISRCSYCPLGANQNYCSPTISHSADTFLILESPNQTACQDNNGWRHSGASFLSKAIMHATGQALSSFHLSFLMKCHCHISGNVPTVKEKKTWGRVCASHYLEWELKGIHPKRIILFGEVVAGVCFPDHTDPWNELIGKELFLNPMEIQTHVLESPSSIVAKGGMNSAEGKEFVEKLHAILGGTLSLPDEAQESNLFDFF